MAGYDHPSRRDQIVFVVKLILLALLVLLIASVLLGGVAKDSPRGRTNDCLRRHPKAGEACIDEEDR